MTREEMEENLGTIAHSGSLRFKKEMEKSDDIDIIGQFGVGFYAAFMVAEKVTVISRRFGSDEAWKWESEGADGYTMEPCERAAAGSDVILTLKVDTDEDKYSDYLSEYRLRSLVRKYSDYIRYPIRMEVSSQKLVNEPKEDEEPKYETVREEQTLNSMIPIWQKAKKDVTEEEYNNFYHEKFFDYEKPLSVLHFGVEGAVTYKALLYIPAKAPYDFYTRDYKAGLQLYSSGVLIMENCADLLPEHFRFVRGVVDTQDLSLNISREMLQHTRELKVIAANLEKKIKAELERMLKDEREKYETFYAAFGRQLKFGLVSDYGMHKDLLQDLVEFRSDKEGKDITLKEYCDAMPESQKHIYFATGDSAARLSQLPQTQLLRERGFDVLLMTEQVDTFIPQTLNTYAEHEFRNILTDDLDLATEEEKKAAEEKAKAFQSGVDFLKESLGEKVKDVRVSTELGQPCRDYGPGRRHELRDGEVHAHGRPVVRLSLRPHSGGQPGASAAAASVREQGIRSGARQKAGRASLRSGPVDGKPPARRPDGLYGSRLRADRLSQVHLCVKRETEYAPSMRDSEVKITILIWGAFLCRTRKSCAQPHPGLIHPAPGKTAGAPATDRWRSGSHVPLRAPASAGATPACQSSAGPPGFSRSCTARPGACRRDRGAAGPEALPPTASAPAPSRSGSAAPPTGQSRPMHCRAAGRRGPAALPAQRRDKPRAAASGHSRAAAAGPAPRRGARGRACAENPDNTPRRTGPQAGPASPPERAAAGRRRR